MCDHTRTCARVCVCIHVFKQLCLKQRVRLCTGVSLYIYSVSARLYVYEVLIDTCVNMHSFTSITHFYFECTYRTLSYFHACLRKHMIYACIIKNAQRAFSSLISQLSIMMKTLKLAYHKFLSRSYMRSMSTLACQGFSSHICTIFNTM